MAIHNSLGSEGENLAALFLSQQGFQILHRNLRIGRLEIDIIAKKENTIHIIEVKTRTATSTNPPKDFSPENAFTTAKKDRILRAAQLFASQNNTTEELSLDLLTILVTPTSPIINLHQALHF